MEEDMYSDTPENQGEPAEAKDEGGETTIIPKSLCPGMKPGDDLTLKIVSVEEDSYQVSYPGDRQESEPSEVQVGDHETDEMYA